MVTQAHMHLKININIYFHAFGADLSSYSVYLTSINAMKGAWKMLVTSCSKVSLLVLSKSFIALNVMKVMKVLESLSSHAMEDSEASPLEVMRSYFGKLYTDQTI